MRIADMFVKPIDRDIKGVIKVGQDDGDNTLVIEIPVTGLSDPTITDVVSDCVNSKNGIYAFGQEWKYIDSSVVKQHGETFIRIYVKLVIENRGETFIKIH